MRHLIVLLLFAELSVATAQAQWWNTWSTKASIALSLHIVDSTVQLYSPMQSDKPLPISRHTWQGDTLLIECKSIGFKTTLIRQDSLWDGHWQQGFVREDIVFQPADTIFSLSRPQTPQAPYAFSEDTIATDYTDSQGNNIHLEGSLMLPHGDGSWPCLVLVSGSGQQNRDEELLFHKPFLVLAHYLAEQGIATLRYDDRGVGASQGPLDSADTRIFAEDAEAMLRAVAINKHIDPHRIGIGGHSEGGAIAPMVAARNSDVKYVVLMAGQGCSGREVLVQQNGAIMQASGISVALCQARQQCMDELFDMSPSSSVKEYQAVIARYIDSLGKARADSIDLRKGMAYTLKQQLDTRWMRTFLSLNPAEYLPLVHCPLLAIGGDKDCQVLAEPNITRIQQLCPQAECHIFPNLNHLFQHCTTGAPSEYVLIDETFAPEAMQAVARFIHSATEP